MAYLCTSSGNLDNWNNEKIQIIHGKKSLKINLELFGVH